jgi:hypothetical protein
MIQETMAIFSFFEKLQFAAEACVGASHNATANVTLKKIS